MNFLKKACLLLKGYRTSYSPAPETVTPPNVALAVQAARQAEINADRAAAIEPETVTPLPIALAINYGLDGTVVYFDYEATRAVSDRAQQMVGRKFYAGAAAQPYRIELFIYDSELIMLRPVPGIRTATLISSYI